MYLGVLLLCKDTNHFHDKLEFFVLVIAEHVVLPELVLPRLPTTTEERIGAHS